MKPDTLLLNGFIDKKGWQADSGILAVHAASDMKWGRL